MSAEERAPFPGITRLCPKCCREITIRLGPPTTLEHADPSCNYFAHTKPRKIIDDLLAIGDN